MVAIRLIGFLGEQPRVIPRLLPEAAAQHALNVRLDDGGLTPIRRPVQRGTAEPGHGTIYRFGEDWLSWAGTVHAAPGPVDDSRLYFTGAGKPKLRVGETVYDLAVPTPSATPVASLGGAGTGDVVTRTYVYTWVTELGEESAPSPPSNLIDWQPGNTVTLSGIGAAPAGRGITRQRFYRSQTGMGGTGLFFIAERAASNADFSDTFAPTAFGEPLPSTNWTAPPDGLSGLCAMPNGMMAAFRGRDLYFCEPWRPHAWPEIYVLTCDSEIVGLGALDTALIVMTRAQPYIAYGSAPEVMQLRKIEANHPCINARAIVDMGFAICYPSHEGLVAVDAAGTASLVTAGIFSRDDWRRLAPQAMCAAQYGGRYVAFYDTTEEDGSALAGALMIEIGASPFIVRAEARASAAWFDVERQALYFLERGGGRIMRFDDPSGAALPLYWKSKPFFVPRPLNFGVLLVDADGAPGAEAVAADAALREEIASNNVAMLAAGSIGGELGGIALGCLPLNGDLLTPPPAAFDAMQVGVIADGRRVAEVNIADQPVRLPAGFKARKWEIDVASAAGVTRIVMGETMADIAGTT